tara:strand:- start:79 stop:279 length:201 start_codon:yes stop_codon:yes gene_type:complete
MQPVAPIPWGCCCGNLSVEQIERISEQRAAQLRQMNTDLMGATGGDRHLQTITLSRALQQLELGVG